VRVRSSAESLGHDDRLQALSVIERFYCQGHHDDPGGPFFGRPAPNQAQIKRVRSHARDGEVLDLRWTSGFEPLWSIEALMRSVGSDSMNSQLALELLATIERARIDRLATLREKYLGSAHNMTAYARWFRHGDGARPVAVLLHGYLGGFYPLEERLWPLRELFDGGMDVVLTVLPFHGLASIDRFAHQHGRMIGEQDQQQLQAEALARAQHVVSPLYRTPKLGGDRTIVLAGRADRVTGIEHSRMLAKHFGTELHTFAGGHLLQVGRAAAFERVMHMLHDAGVHQARSSRAV
jgi:hypothetical protein